DERIAVRSRFDHENAVTPTRNEPIAHWECLTIRFNLHRELGHDCAISGANFLGKSSVFRWIQSGQSGAHHGDRATFRGERPLVSGGVDPACETADYGQSRIGKLISQFFADSVP